MSYVQAGNERTSNIKFLNVPNLLMKEDFILIILIEIDLVLSNSILVFTKLCVFIRIINKKIIFDRWGLVEII